MSGRQHKKQKPTTQRPEADDVPDDEEDEGYDDDDDFDDEDDYEPGVDDHETLRLERERMENASGRQWTEISATLSSITFAMPVYKGNNDHLDVLGTVMLVKSWGLDGEPMQSTVWMPGVDVADVEGAGDPPPPTTTPQE